MTSHVRSVVILNIKEMIKDSRWIYFVLYWLALACSCALSGLMPQGQVRHTHTTAQD